MKITKDEWLAELSRISKQQATDGVTVAELAKSFGTSPDPVRKRLKALIQSGAWELAGTRLEPGIDGREQRIPIYRPKPKGKK